MSCHRPGAVPGSDGIPVRPNRRAEARPVQISKSSERMGRSRTNHAVYQGRRYGIARAKRSMDVPHASPGVGRLSRPRNRHIASAKTARKMARTR